MRFSLLDILGLLIGSCVLFSCQIEKRVHRPGYHVQYKKSNASRSAKVEQSKESKRAKESQMLTFLESDELSASANDEVIISTKKKETTIEKPDTEVEVSEVVKSDIVDYYTDCETLVYTNGVEAKVKVKEITPQHIKYYRCDMENVPLISTKRSDVHKIIYSNGVEEVFNEKRSPEPESNYNSAGKTLEIFGIISVVCSITAFFTLAIFMGPMAIVFGLISIIRSSSASHAYKGKLFGYIGLIAGIIITVVMLRYLSVI